MRSRGGDHGSGSSAAAAIGTTRRSTAAITNNGSDSPRRTPRTRRSPLAHNTALGWDLSSGAMVPPTIRVARLFSARGEETETD